MRNEISRVAALALVLVFGPLSANATPTFDPVNGHHYEVVPSNGIDWQTASEMANALEYAGVLGHLATLSSVDEDDFVDQLRQDSLTGTGGLSQGQVWIGGFQTGTDEPSGGWQWVNGEGAFPGNNSGPVYANWADPEPNNAGAGEHHLALGRYGQGNGWNDEGAALGLIGGYVVEYDTEIVIKVATCLEPEGCELPGSTLIFPPSTDSEEDDEITVQSFEFDDSDARCGVEPLILFGDANPMPDLIVPKWLCGSPKFLILAIDSSDIEIPSGTVFVENETQDVLPDNLYTCDSPDIPVGSDLRHQDVVAWQSTEFDEMVEHRYQIDNVDGEFSDLAGPYVMGVASPGSMVEYTNGCGSSRARVRGSSYYGIGFHIHPADTEVNDPGNTLFEFIRLIRYKLAVLQLAVVDAKPPVLSRNDFRQLKKQVKQAIKQMDLGDFNASLTHMENFMRLVEDADYNIVDDTNHNGEHLSRGDNIIFMLREKSSLP